MSEPYMHVWSQSSIKPKGSIRPITFAKPVSHFKAWGEEVWLVNNDLYCGKILRFIKDKSFSLHSHDIKTESWYVTMGSLKLTYFDLSNADKQEITLVPGDVIHVPRGNPHQLTALEDSEVIEISTKHDEADSYRIGKGASQT